MNKSELRNSGEGGIGHPCLTIDSDNHSPSPAWGRPGWGVDRVDFSLPLVLLPCLGKAGMGISYIILISAPTSNPPSQGRKTDIVGFLECLAVVSLTLMAHSVKSTKFCQPEFLIKRVSLNCSSRVDFSLPLVLTPHPTLSSRRGIDTVSIHFSQATTHKKHGNIIQPPSFTPIHSSQVTPHEKPGSYQCGHLIVTSIHYSQFTPHKNRGNIISPHSFTPSYLITQSLNHLSESEVA